MPVNSPDPSHKKQRTELESFKDPDTNAVYACVGPMGCAASFRLRNPLASDASRESLAPNYPAWDAVHQGIYRAQRAEGTTADELPADVRSLPAIPQGPFPQWKDYFLPEEPIKAPVYPLVTRLLKGRQDEAVKVFVVLHENSYEPALGDGEFHYIQDVFLNEEDAQRYMDQTPGEFHLRTMSINPDHDVFGFPDFMPEHHDHRQVEDVLTALEERLQD